MKDMMLYDRDFPAIRFADDPFSMMDHILSGEPFYDGQFRMPAVDVREEDKRYLIEAELPGLTDKDVKLEVKNGVLTLSTAKKEEKNDRDPKNPLKFLRRERREFAFQRSFELPEDVDAEHIDAQFKNGILSVALPKKEIEPAKTIQVKVA